MTTKDWEQYGIVWEMRDVAKQRGDNASDKVVIGQCPIPRLVDVPKALDAGLKGAILKGINGTSWVVMAQDVGRRMLEKNRRVDPEVVKQLVFARLLSQRVGSVTVVERKVEVHRLQDGTVYDGQDEVEWKQLGMMLFVDMGVSVEVAQAAVDKWVW